MLEQYARDRGLTLTQALEEITDLFLKRGVRPIREGRVVQMRARKGANQPD